MSIQNGWQSISVSSDGKYVSAIQSGNLKPYGGIYIHTTTAKLGTVMMKSTLMSHIIMPSEIKDIFHLIIQSHCPYPQISSRHRSCQHRRRPNAAFGSIIIMVKAYGPTPALVLHPSTATRF